MPKRTIILTGAPESSALDWDSAKLLSEFQDNVARFARHKRVKRDKDVASRSSGSQPKFAVWRSLSLEKKSISTGFSQQFTPSFPYIPAGSFPETATEFLTTISLSSTSDDHHVENKNNLALSQFYEHSLAMHQQDLASSQLIMTQSSVYDTTSYMSDEYTTSLLSGQGSQQPPKEPLPLRDVIVDLTNIPSAAYLERIQPQTVTCTLIVGIISISQPRMITTRWGATKHLVEVLVGDETKAGFAITYWLPSDSVSNSPLAGLRPQDIVLMQHVGLNVFSGRVYGCSLRRDLTKVHLLYRARLDSKDTGGYYSTTDLSAHSPHPQLRKTRRVRDWVINFVGQGAVGPKSKSRPRWDVRPADETQLP
ncbi:uncharacterized protein CTHT_0040800 [Thermochaetoides thermophila DSM 1495]|uniref:Uncharacterized protein n=1 Tax=Chaetomium thermophilum (strain DSM 1495 / CBS 144.50 / IMI 039719) TaxID=759272 RepID=G0SA29_CHATD|nr:hypothetical protein CTHT_0040800 [Thermochaetoides thermophila DSM 1495]EGS19601.1 hypothetical protein CTHT_0040800 [Thermochaetoides thermophila DSM 1495]